MRSRLSYALIRLGIACFQLSARIDRNTELQITEEKHLAQPPRTHSILRKGA